MDETAKKLFNLPDNDDDMSCKTTVASNVSAERRIEVSGTVHVWLSNSVPAREASERGAGRMNQP
jgi:hypothetical protein